MVSSYDFIGVFLSFNLWEIRGFFSQFQNTDEHENQHTTPNDKHPPFGHPENEMRGAAATTHAQDRTEENTNCKLVPNLFKISDLPRFFFTRQFGPDKDA